MVHYVQKFIYLGLFKLKASVAAEDNKSVLSLEGITLNIEVQCNPYQFLNREQKEE